MRKKVISVSLVFALIFSLIICGNISKGNVSADKNNRIGVQKTLLMNKTQENIYYRVIAGSFKERANAEEMVLEFKEMGIDAFITNKVIRGESYNRVVVGSFTERKNAENLINQLEVKGMDAFIDIYIEETDIAGDSNINEVGYYAVIAGSFENKKNADERVNLLKSYWIDSYVSNVVIDGKEYNRVIAGSFIKEENANNMVKILKSYGVDAFVNYYVESKENFSNKTESQLTTYYAVIAGSFKDISNSSERVKLLKSYGIDCYEMSTLIDGQVYYRVIAGSFTKKGNAQNMIETLKNKGIDAFIDVYIQ